MNIFKKTGDKMENFNRDLESNNNYYLEFLN